MVRLNGDTGERTPLIAAPDTVPDFSDVEVYPLVHEIRVDIVAHIDTPLTYDQLIAPDSTYTIIRPLVDKYLTARNPSVIFCLLLNRVQFISDSHKLSIATLSISRATLCEILATRVLRGWSERTLPLATVLLTSWRMFAGAPKEVVDGCKEEEEEEVLENSGTALEMAIISSSKRFIRSASCQKVIEGIWSGKIIYSSHSTHALIQDNYKKRPLQIYNPHTAPVLDHYRLKVPRIRALLEYANFVILFILYIVAIERLKSQEITPWETVFMVYAVAFSVDKIAATREHGMKVFASSLVNGFDLIFVIIFLLSFFARLYGHIFAKPGSMSFGADLLAIGAVLIFPRLVFMTLANNLMILSIRSMLMEFAFLMTVGIICFLGFLYALYTLGEGRFKPSEITWWLLEIYFGLDATGFLTSSQLHPFLGPVLIVIYAFLSNTLLLTVAVAILGNTFAVINADAGAESMFRKAVATVEGVKADSVFSYQLPFNLIALSVLYPLSFVLNPRWFHKVNVTMIRLTNLPVLLIIALYERQNFSNMTVWERVCDYCDHYMGKITSAAGFESIVGTRMDVSAVFEVEREFGTFYAGWDEAGPDDERHDVDENCFEDEEEATEGSDHRFDNKVTMSPVEGTFRIPSTSTSDSQQDSSGLTRTVSNSTTTPQRKRRNSLSMILNPPSSIGAGSVPPPGPLPRLGPRNASFYGPSPLAQLFVRSPDDNLANRRSTVAVGSLPAASALPGMGSSPLQRNRLSSGGSGSGLSASMSTSTYGSTDPRGAARHMKAPSITPIPEDTHTSAASSAINSPRGGPSSELAPESPKRPSILFPTHNVARSRTVSFESRPTASPTSLLSPTSSTKQLPSPAGAPADQTPSPSPEKQRADEPEKRDKPPPPTRTPSGSEKPEKSGLRRTSSATKMAAPSPRLKPTAVASAPGLKASGREGKPMTASELLEAMEAAGAADQDSMVQVAAMAKLEERQKRMETLLEQILAAQLSANQNQNQTQGDSSIIVRPGLRCGPRREEPHDTFDDDL